MISSAVNARYAERTDGAFDGPIALTVGRSQTQLNLMLMGHTATVLAILPLPLEPWMLIIVCSAIAMHAIGEFRAHQTDHPDDVVALLLRRDDSWQLRLRDGQLEQVTLKRAFPVMPTMLNLVFLVREGGTREVVLFADNTEIDHLRRLRVRLRLRR